MRFWEVKKGKIAIVGISPDDSEAAKASTYGPGKAVPIDINEVNTANLRDMESYMTQETQMFKDTIAGNIRVAKLDATQEEIEDACKKASIHDWIMTLPNGYETNVGELGDTLSGGERQRIGLARAFLHGAPFLLLDEPTSNLDSLNEAVILKALREESKGRTVLLVSHRKSTMRVADQTISMA
jgi:ATP-binding cassette subfamily C protein